MGEQTAETEGWRRLLTGQDPHMRKGRRLRGMIPAPPRCKMCNAPFGGVGRPLMRLVGRRQSRWNPHFCAVCENYARNHRGGAEIEFTMLFADIRGSTSLAESMGTAAFSALIDRFFRTATDVLVAEDAMINRLIGDEAVAFFLPVLVPSGHAQAAVRAARNLLEATGHAEPSGPWAPMGIGVNTGTAFLGVVGGALVGEPGDLVDFTALGDEVNTTARLASLAGPGEILLTEATRAAAELPQAEMEPRHLRIKGRAASVEAWVIRVGAQVAAPSGV